MTFTVKICGLTTPESVDAALAAGADMLGFVFYEKSPRHVSFETARKLSAHVAAYASPQATKVALTVDANDATLAALIADLKPQMLQLHGKEDAARVFDIRTRFGLPVMKAISLATPDDLGSIADYAKVADWLLFDAKIADSGISNRTLPGGNGQSFDWTLLAGLKLDKPWLLAGGLTADNVAEAIKTSRAPGVDVSSGVESARGVKDAAKIAAFIARARQAAERQMA